MRKVRVQYTPPNKPAVDYVGIFHEWGTDYEDGGNDTVVSCSVGIIESSDGEVHLEYPPHIKFLDGTPTKHNKTH